MDIQPTFKPLQPGDPDYERCRQRLKEDLGLEEEALEVILNLRNQVTHLQARLRTLEGEIRIYQSTYTSRLSRFKQVYYEAEWEETEQE